MRKAIVFAGLLGALGLGVVGPSYADERTDARAYYNRGIAYLKESPPNYAAAIGEFEKAYGLRQHPNLLFNIARAHGELGNRAEAIAYYKRYLESDPKDREEIQKIVDRLEAQGRPKDPPPPPPKTTTSTPAILPTSTSTPGVVPTTTSTPAGGKVISAPVVRDEGIFEETIVTASKAAQSPLDAPNSTSIITEQDIRMSGLLQIPELLRRLAGVDIMQMTGATAELSLRGFNQRFSNKVLILINGKSAYVDLVGSAFFPMFTIAVEDIDRIEVVRGPGAALYGANAVNGVVNIITKAPGTGKSGFNLGFGEYQTTHASTWATGRDAGFSWRIAGGYDYRPRWSREIPSGRVDMKLASSDQSMSQRTMRLDIRTQRKLSDTVTMSVGGGLNRFVFDTFGIGNVNNHFLDGTFFDVTAGVTADSLFTKKGSLEARVYWNSFQARTSNNAASIGQSILPTQLSDNLIDADVRYSNEFSLGGSVENMLQVGVNYRYKGVNWTFQDRFRYEHHFGAYLHDEIRFGEKRPGPSGRAPFALVGDYRADYVPYLSRVVHSPRIAGLWHPTNKSTLRASFGTSFRTPAFLEAYLNTPVQLPAAGAMLVSEGVRADNKNFKLEPENVLSAELGFLSTDSEYITLDTALFYTRTTQLIQLADTRPVAVADLSNPDVAATGSVSTGLYQIHLGGFDNQCQKHNLFGVELGARVYPVKGVDVWANYTLSAVRQDNSACTEAQQAALRDDKRTSMHKINAGAQWRSPWGLDAEVAFHYVSPQTWAERVSSVERARIEEQSFALDAYYLLNARLGYRFLKNMAEVSVAGYNLTDNRHKQHPFGQQIGRRTMGFLTYKF